MKKILLIAYVLMASTALMAQGKAPANPPYESSLFRSMQGTYFDLENDNLGVQGQLNILNWLQGRVAGLQIYNIRGISVPFMRNYPATVYVDEMRTDASFLSMLPVQDIALIKVIRMPGVVNSRGGGIIAIYTKRGEAEEEEG